MGDHADGEPCCNTCGKYAGGDAPEPSSRAPLVGRLDELKIIVESRGTRIELTPDKPVIVLGRGGAADIVVADFALSRQQLKFVFREGYAYVADLGSACGTIVDGAKLTRGAVKLDRGSKIEFGNSTAQIVRVRSDDG